MTGDLRIDGEVGLARGFTCSELRALPEQVPDVSALLPGCQGQAVWLRSLLAVVRPTPRARFVRLASGDGRFAISVPIGDLASRAIIVHGLGGGPLPAARGGPLRLYVVEASACGAGGGGGPIDACANVKGLGSIRLTAEREDDVGHAHAGR